MIMMYTLLILRLMNNTCVLIYTIYFIQFHRLDMYHHLPVQLTIIIAYHCHKLIICATTSTRILLCHSHQTKYGLYINGVTLANDLSCNS